MVYNTKIVCSEIYRALFPHGVMAAHGSLEPFVLVRVQVGELRNGSRESIARPVLISGGLPKLAGDAYCLDEIGEGGRFAHGYDTGCHVRLPLLQFLAENDFNPSDLTQSVR